MAAFTRPANGKRKTFVIFVFCVCQILRTLTQKGMAELKIIVFNGRNISILHICIPLLGNNLIIPLTGPVTPDTNWLFFGTCLVHIGNNCCQLGTFPLLRQTSRVHNWIYWQCWWMIKRRWIILWHETEFQTITHFLDKLICRMP